MKAKKVKGWFFEERGNWSTRRKPLGAEWRANKLNPHMTPSQGIEPGPHWWEAECPHHCAVPVPPWEQTFTLLEMRSGIELIHPCWLNYNDQPLELCLK